VFLLQSPSAQRVTTGSHAHNRTPIFWCVCESNHNTVIGSYNYYSFSSVWAQEPMNKYEHFPAWLQLFHYQQLNTEKYNPKICWARGQLGSNLNSYLTGNVILDENSEPFSSISTITMTTSQHSSFTEESFQCSAFFMEHPGAWSQNGDKRKGIVEAPSRSWTQRRLILLFAFVLSCCLYISLPLPLHQTDYRQLEAGRQCHEIGSSSYFCH